nr:retrovirus-related Pol polyprotein from transposon TNT 1-94 [Tanacetum cinerariifolium]
MNSLPKKWPSFSQGLRNENHTQTLDLVDIYGRFVYEDNLISKRYYDTKKALITTPSDSSISTTFFSNNIMQDFQENSDDEADERSCEEYLRDLELKFHERALLANSKRFIKRKQILCKKQMRTLNVINVVKSQGEPKVQKDYKAEYTKMKVKLTLLEASPLTSQSSKSFQSKNKGLVAKMFNWDEEEVSYDEEETQVKVLIDLTDDELSVGKNHAHNG